MSSNVHNSRSLMEAQNLHQLSQIQLAGLQTYDLSSVVQTYDQLQPNQYVNAEILSQCCFLLNIVRLADATWPSNDSSLMIGIERRLKACQRSTNKCLSNLDITVLKNLITTRSLPVLLSLAAPSDILAAVKSTQISPSGTSKLSKILSNMRPVVQVLLEAGAKLVWCEIFRSPSDGSYSVQYCVRAFAQSEAALLNLGKSGILSTLQIFLIEDTMPHDLPSVDPKYYLASRIATEEDPLLDKLPGILLDHGASVCWINPHPQNDEDCRIFISLDGKSKEEFEKEVRKALSPEEAPIISLFSYSSQTIRYRLYEMD